MKNCAMCKAEKPSTAFNVARSRKDGLQSTCRACERMYQLTEAGKKASRKNKKNQREKFPEKEKAHQAVKYAIRSGRLLRPDTCEFCEEKRPVHGHHSDYDKILEIDWVCRDCHTELHLALKGF